MHCTYLNILPILNIFFVDVTNYISEQERHELENDPLCGLTTGGSEECWWRCNIQRVEHPLRPGIFLKLILNPSCLSECYPADHCLSSLLADYQAAGGVCQGSYLDVRYPGVFNVSDQPCVVGSSSSVFEGLCSDRTKELLRDQENCVIPIYTQKPSILRSTTNL